MTREMDKIRNTLMLYENIEKLELQNKKCKESIKQHEVEKAIVDIANYNETELKIIQTFEILLVNVNYMNEDEKRDERK